MIEEDLANVEKRVEALEAKLTNVIKALAAGFGDDHAMALGIAEARLATLEQHLAAARTRSADDQTLFVELARALSVRGPITREALLNAAKRKKRG